MALTLGLAACGPKAPGAAASSRSESAASEASYHAPPVVTQAQALPGGALLVSGSAAPGVKVRLATPAGQASYADVDSKGAWRLALPAAAQMRLFGLSMSLPGRAVQAEGYFAVTPEGRLAELRAGAGAVTLGETGFRISAVDFDRQGGAVVSGLAAAKASLRVFVDGAARGVTPAGAEGRFSVALNEPLTPGDHLLAVADGAQTRSVTVSIGPAEPLTAGPFRAERVPEGWRVDWVTPGGGVQSTLLLDPKAGRGAG